MLNHAFGFDVYIANTAPVEKFFNIIGLSMNAKTVRAFLENCIGTAFAASQSDCPFLTGFLQSSGRAEMIDDYSGRIIYDADYATPQEDGYINRSGRFVKGKHYLRPNADLAFRLMVNEMNKFYTDVFSTGRISAVPTAKMPTISGHVSKKARGPHKFTQQRITATGRKSSLFRGPSIVKTKVFRPGTGKSQRQAGRMVRIGGLR